MGLTACFRYRVYESRLRVGDESYLLAIARVNGLSVFVLLPSYPRGRMAKYLRSS